MQLGKLFDDYDCNIVDEIQELSGSIHFKIPKMSPKLLSFGKSDNSKNISKGATCIATTNTMFRIRPEFGYILKKPTSEPLCLEESDFQKYPSESSDEEIKLPKGISAETSATELPKDNQRTDINCSTSLGIRTPENQHQVEIKKLEEPKSELTKNETHDLLFAILQQTRRKVLDFETFKQIDRSTRSNSQTSALLRSSLSSHPRYGPIPGCRGDKDEDQPEATDNLLKAKSPKEGHRTVSKKVTFSRTTMVLRYHLDRLPC